MNMNTQVEKKRKKKTQKPNQTGAMAKGNVKENNHDAKEEFVCESTFDQVLKERTVQKQRVIELEERFRCVRNGLEDEFERHFGANAFMEIKAQKAKLSSPLQLAVIGETSSGKSAFLNLMLGAEMLPVGHMCTTTDIIKIRKGPSLKVVPRDMNPITTNTRKIFSCPKESSLFVRKVLMETVTSKKSKETPSRETTIYWPFECELLKNDVILVDLPGYGENQTMSDLVTEYLPKLDGFLYIVDAGNAGGIQSDRLKAIIREQLKYCKDPLCTLFFLNKWDQIPIDDEYSRGESRITETETEKRVWKNSIDKVQSLWTHTTEYPSDEQVMKFSVWKENGKLYGPVLGLPDKQADTARQKILDIQEKCLSHEVHTTKQWILEVSRKVDIFIERKKELILERLEKLEKIKFNAKLSAELKAKFPKWDTDVSIHKDKINKEQPLIVAGETSSGKSSFLNIMLDAPMLPVNHLHSTAGIIKVVKGDRLALEPENERAIVATDESVLQDKEKAAKFVRDNLEKLVTSKESGADEAEKTVCTETKVIWPFKCPLLKDNVTIVDTPGYGETEAMKDMIREYLPKAVGFLYIINAGHAGGVQGDRLEAIIADQKGYFHNHGVELMDPRRVLFICNKWDQIPNEDEYSHHGAESKSRPAGENQQRVWSSINGKLGDLWHHFSPEQAMKFSVRQARGRVKCVGVDDDQELYVREKILNVVNDCLDHGMDPSLRWVNSVTEFLAELIQGRITALEESMQKRERVLEEVRAIEVFIEDAPIIVKTEIKNEMEKLAASLVMYLNDNNFKTRMNVWSYKDFPCGLFGSSDNMIRNESIKVILKKLGRMLLDENQQRLGRSRSKISSFFAKSNKEVEKRISRLHQIVPKDNECCRELEVKVLGSYVSIFDSRERDLVKPSQLKEIRPLSLPPPIGRLFWFGLTAMGGSSPHAFVLRQYTTEILEQIDKDFFMEKLFQTAHLEREIDSLSKKHGDLLDTFDRPCRCIEALIKEEELEHKRYKELLKSFSV